MNIFCFSGFNSLWSVFKNGDSTLGKVGIFSAVPAADEFLYLTLGATTDADYTAGKLLIELFGYEA